MHNTENLMWNWGIKELPTVRLAVVLKLRN